MRNKINPSLMLATEKKKEVPHSFTSYLHSVIILFFYILCYTCYLLLLIAMGMLVISHILILIIIFEIY